MISNFKLKISNSEKGVSLIITFFIMIIILTVVLSISALLYSEVRVIRNMGNSVASFYAAESGIEKVLYYDRQVLPIMVGKTAARGLCSMYIYDITNNPNACVPDLTPSNPNDDNIYCAPNTGFTTPQTGSTNPNYGCDYDVCDDCTISFNTIFDSRTYSVTASVNSSYYLDIASGGAFGGAARKIEITTPLQ